MRHTDGMADAQRACIRRIAGQVVDDMLTDLIDDLNLSGAEADSRAADRLERVRTLHRARITAPASRPGEQGRKPRTCPVAPDVCGDILGWEAFIIHIYETHTDSAQPNAARLESVGRILKQGGDRG